MNAYERITAPADLPQWFTLTQTKPLLRQGANALDAAPGTDPSHDPGVTLETATPGEIKSRGTGLTIRAGVAASPFGHCLIGETPRGICHLSFFDERDREDAIAGMVAGWPLAGVEWDNAQAARIAGEVFHPAPCPSSPWKLFVRGTPFQLRVWRTLLRVPPGALVSYGKLAAASGNPNASRATGRAVGANPVAFLIPCHRVIRETGIPGHYRWGAVRKHAILAWESARHSTPTVPE